MYNNSPKGDAMKAKDILKNKGPEVFTIGENKPLSEALNILINNNIGVLLVLGDTGLLTGIMSERDVVRAVHRKPENFLNIPVSDLMTRKILFADYEDDLSYIENIMTSNKVRHIPIMKDRIMVGLISIGDIVKATLRESKVENKYLMEYIAGNIH
ncbi:MAG: CBS domain-containing protein [Candidatus Kapabacteria bacterium]|nr:CBS domain-containing protein [Ignavibacteriota bacterium]MCW5883902.1 CBS domain-containing protein [Candidatus Kapabacteria bacterium]